MKRFYLIISSFLFIFGTGSTSLQCTAKQAPPSSRYRLVIHHQSDSTVIDLSDGLTLTMEGSKIFFQNSNGQTTSYSLQDVKLINLFLGDANDIHLADNMGKQRVLFNRNGSTMSIIGINEGKANIQVYSLDGKPMLTIKGTSERRIDASLLPKGIYIIRVNNYVFKVNKP